MNSLAMTVDYMTSEDYKLRMVAEYWQLKMRYEKLKRLNTRIEACSIDIHLKKPNHNTPISLLKKQQATMGEYLHLLEIRAELEDIDLSMIDVKKTTNGITVTRTIGGNDATFPQTHKVPVSFDVANNPDDGKMRGTEGYDY